MSQQEFKRNLKTLLLFLHTGYVIVTIGILLYICSFIFIKKEGPRLIIQPIALTIFTAGFIGLIFEYRIRVEFIDDVKNQLSFTLDEKQTQFDEMDDHSILGFKQKLNEEELFNSFQHANRIKIVNTFAPNIDELLIALEEAAKKGCFIQILLLHPFSPQTIYRSLDFKHPDKENYKKVRNHLDNELPKLINYIPYPMKLSDINHVQFIIIGQIKTISNLEKKYKRNIKIRFYETVPRFSYYCWDDQGYVGIFWNNKHVIATPQIKIRDTNKGLSCYINREFDYMWERAEKLEAVAKFIEKCKKCTS